jgi:hypothetical protein
MSFHTPATRASALTLLGICMATLVPAALASSAAPAVVTHAASQVAYATAVLNGSVTAHDTQTTYYFQYGTTSAYGSQTAAGDAGTGTAAVPVSATVTGLQPATTYHFRLVALNAAGARAGGDRSFKTAAIPLSLQILGAPNPTTYASAAVIEGTLAGTGNAGQAVVLQQNPFPYTSGFSDVGNAELTSASGGFSFPVLDLLAATQFRVAAVSTPVIVSPIVTEEVAVQVSILLQRTRSGRQVRIYGAVTPAEPGMAVEILRLLHGRAVRVATTYVRPLPHGGSHYSHIMPLRRGAIYEAYVHVTNGAQASAYSAPIRVG